MKTYSSLPWLIAVNANLNCPNCNDEMKIFFKFFPTKGKVAGYSRSELQDKGFEFWKTTANSTFVRCTCCGWKK